MNHMKAKEWAEQSIGAAWGQFDANLAVCYLERDRQYAEAADAITVASNGWNDATALREARWQAEKERCWQSRKIKTRRCGFPITTCRERGSCVRRSFWRS